MMTHEVRVARFLARYGPELARHLRRLLQDDELAQDALQDTMLRAHRAMTRLGPTVNERAWLYRIATNVALNQIRSRVRERRALERHARDRSGEFHPETDGGADQTERRRAALWSRVAELPERQRVALTLRVADELEYEEIAARMGSTVEAARANVYQATRKLKTEAPR